MIRFSVDCWLSQCAMTRTDFLGRISLAQRGRRHKRASDHRVAVQSGNIAVGIAGLAQHFIGMRPE